MVGLLYIYKLESRYQKVSILCVQYAVVHTPILSMILSIVHISVISNLKYSGTKFINIVDQIYDQPVTKVYNTYTTFIFGLHSIKGDGDGQSFIISLLSFKYPSRFHIRLNSFVNFVQIFHQTISISFFFFNLFKFYY